MEMGSLGVRARLGFRDQHGGGDELHEGGQAMSEMPAMRLAVVRLAHFSAYRGDWPWIHFTMTELADPATGELVVVPAFLDWLEIVRHAFGRPIIVNDATRPAARQQRHSGRVIGSHVDGMAIDVRVHGEDAELLERVAIEHGVLGRGVYQSHDTPFEQRFLHLDRWTKAPPGLRPRLWSG